MSLYFAIYGNDHCFTPLNPGVYIVRLSLELYNDFFNYHYLPAANSGI